jgi:hypothetical protein
MHARTLLLWIAVGLVGLVLAAGISYAATQLSRQRIGLAAEPPSAGAELAPARTGMTGPGAPAGGRRAGPGEQRRAGGHGRDLDD